MSASTEAPLWLVTGASGFLGANLGFFLNERGERIAVTRSGTTPPGFDSAVAADLAHPDALAQHVMLRRPTVVIHAAAMASHEQCEADPQRAHRINVDATESIAAAAATVGATFVLISTDAVFDGAQGQYREDDLPNPTSVYGKTKLLAEQRAMAVSDAMIIRTNFFGWSPSGRRSILEFFVNELSAGHRVRGFTDFTTSSAYAQVLAETIVELTERSATGVFHVTSPDALTKYEFGLAAAQTFGLDSNLITPTTADIHPPRSGNISLDVSKVQVELGHQLPTQVEGLQRAAHDATMLRPALRGPASP